MALPVSRGGLGLRSISQIAKLAYPAAVAQAMPLISGFRSSPDNSDFQTSLERICSTVSSMLGEDADQDRSGSAQARRSVFPRSSEEFWNSYSASCPPKLQQLYTKKFNARCLQRLMTTPAGLSGDELVEHKCVQARLRSSVGPIANHWLMTPPSERQLFMQNDEYELSIFFRLGLPLPFAVECRCGLSTTDFHHFHTCNHNSGLWTLRHDLLKSDLHSLLTEASATAIVEGSAYSSAYRASGAEVDRKRGDLTIFLAGRQHLTDVSVAHPCGVATLSGAAATQLSAADARVQEKVDKYGAIAARGGMVFVPFVMETYGAAVKAVHGLIKQLAGNAQSNHGMDSAAFTRRAKSILSVTLQKGNCRVIHH
jgi:hypothetical protein